MQNEIFSAMALDALGEMMNISLGSSATAVSNMLDHRVDITTPTVSVISMEDFTLGNIEPAMGVEIKYVAGLEGSNIMLLKRSDIKVIVDILMGMESDDEEFELNELTISAVCELMNQMMGAASTALSDFLGFSVNISTPEPFELDNLPEFKETHLPQGAEVLVVVRFSLKIEDALESEFMNIMSVDLAKELLAGLGLEDEVLDGSAAGTATQPEPAPAPAADSGKKLSQEEIERLMQGAMSEPEPAPAPAADSGKKLSQEEIERLMQSAMSEPEPAPAPAADSGKKLSQEEIERLMQGAMSEPAPAPTPPPAPAPQQMPAAPAAQMPQQMPQMPMMPPMMPPMPVPGDESAMGYGQMGYPPMYYPYPYPYPPQQMPQASVAPEPKVINTQPVPMQQMDAAEQLGEEQAQNLELIMEVPLQVTVEIGRTKRKVQDILEFSKGSLVVLDKLAGDQVDLFVNGKCIARGDVVVIDDNFGVRITEIVQKTGLEKAMQK